MTAATADKAPTKLIPVRFIADRETWTDHLFDSGAVFKRGQVSMVPDWAAALLLKYDTMFEDARKAGKGKWDAIVAERPRDIEKERREMDEVEQHVRIDLMTKDQLAHHAMRAFGVRIDATDLKVDVKESVRHLIRTRGV